MAHRQGKSGSSYHRLPTFFAATTFIWHLRGSHWLAHRQPAADSRQLVMMTAAVSGTCEFVEPENELIYASDTHKKKPKHLFSTYFLCYNNTRVKKWQMANGTCFGVHCEEKSKHNVGWVCNQHSFSPIFRTFPQFGFGGLMSFDLNFRLFLWALVFLPIAFVVIDVCANFCWIRGRRCAHEFL